MAQSLLLGLGGTGSRIVNYVAEELRKKGIGVNDGNICCAVLDTNDNDREKLEKSGTGIPVIATSANRNIDGYLDMYPEAKKWMPYSRRLGRMSMKDGASQMRAKSRLAFMDTIESRNIHKLEAEINKLFNKKDGANIRVVIVSSLAGGTGSGMFIQTALWLRRYFANRSQLTIRGIFVLPDVFIDTLDDMRKDPTEIRSLYANAYGAIRELNAITKIATKGLTLQRPVIIDNLFDGKGNGDPVYDYSFFIDNISEGGSVLTQIDHYEQVASRMVYMQLYAPMSDDLYSEEDNLFKRFEECPDPVFGSCGTAKAVYPYEDVLEYCALRAARESLSTGWKRIDDEIKEKQRREDEKKKSGKILKTEINPRSEYIRSFDTKAGKTGDQIGADKLFVGIAHDIENETREKGEEDNTVISYSDKVEDFAASLETLVTKLVDGDRSGELRKIILPKLEMWPAKDEKGLKDEVEKKERAVKNFISSFKDSLEANAEELADSVCPSDMGDINEENAGSVFGFLTKKDNNGETYFVHPIAVRYLLYKFEKKLDEIKQKFVLDQEENNALKGFGGGQAQTDFDNPRTRAVESSAKEYLDSKKKLQSEEKFIKVFREKYHGFNDKQHKLCRKFAIDSLLTQLAVVLSQRLEALIKIVEDFFDGLESVYAKLGDEIDSNVRKNEQIIRKIIYVCASEAEKETAYNSLRLATDASDVAINGIVVRALYGKFCSKVNPTAKNNKDYEGKSVKTVFENGIIETYKKLIVKEHNEDIDLDIYSAVCKRVDYEFEKARNAEDAGDDDADEGNAAEEKHGRHINAMIDLKDRLLELGAPFLICDEGQRDDHTGEFKEDEHDVDFDLKTKKHKTFWGFNPVLAAKCEELGEILGVNVASQQNEAYAKNELDCYRAVYGIQAKYIPKFNELKGGEYYKNYSSVIRKMVRDVGDGNTEALINTPHIDKTWHLFLPYISPDMRENEDRKFYRCFWLALAYGMLTVGSEGTYKIVKTRTSSFGDSQIIEPVVYNGENVRRADVAGLLGALRLDGSFIIEAESLEKAFKKECGDVLGNASYESTEFLRGKRSGSRYSGGGLASKYDNNAVTIIIRYYNTPNSDNIVTGALRQSLEQLCEELVANKYDSYDEAKINNKAYEMCKRIFEASDMKSKDMMFKRISEEIKDFENWGVTKSGSTKKTGLKK